MDWPVLCPICEGDMADDDRFKCEACGRMVCEFCIDEDFDICLECLEGSEE